MPDANDRGGYEVKNYYCILSWLPAIFSSTVLVLVS